MAGKNLLFTFQSCADLNDLWEAIAMPRDPWSGSEASRLAAAESFATQFEKICNLLPNHPEVGADRDDLNAGVRSVSMQRCVIYYRTRGDNVEVLRVLRGSGDVGSSF